MLQGLAPKKRVAGPAQTLYPLISQNRTVTIPLPHPSQGWTLGHFKYIVCSMIPKLTKLPRLNPLLSSQSYLFTHQTGSSLKGALFVAVAHSMDPCDWRTKVCIC